jgi:hypothetical protein
MGHEQLSQAVGYLSSSLISPPYSSPQQQPTTKNHNNNNNNNQSQSQEDGIQPNQLPQQARLEWPRKRIHHHQPSKTNNSHPEEEPLRDRQGQGDQPPVVGRPIHSDRFQTRSTQNSNNNNNQNNKLS